MRFYYTESTDPYYNLAAEEWLLRNSEDDIVMLWQNAPSIIIGKNQNLYFEADAALAAERGVKIARRITGGGAVYHDLGNVNYSFITSRDRAEVLDFAYFTAPILKALDALGVKAELSGRNDLLLDGLKFSGNAQTATETRILHHGTLLFDSELSAMQGILRPAPEKLAKRGIQSVRSRVTNLRPFLPGSLATAADFIAYLTGFFSAEYGVLPECVDRQTIEASGLPARNASEAWIYGRRDNLPLSASKQFPFGFVRLGLALSDGIIEKAALEGDFFGEKAPDELCRGLVGIKACAAELTEALRDVPLGSYIHGMSIDEFVSLCEEAAGSFRI